MLRWVACLDQSPGWDSSQAVAVGNITQHSSHLRSPTIRRAGDLLPLYPLSNSWPSGRSSRSGAAGPRRHAPLRRHPNLLTRLTVPPGSHSSTENDSLLSPNFPTATLGRPSDRLPRMEDAGHRPPVGATLHAHAIAGGAAIRQRRRRRATWLQAQTVGTGEATWWCPSNSRRRRDTRTEVGSMMDLRGSPCDMAQVNGWSWSAAGRVANRSAPIIDCRRDWGRGVRGAASLASHVAGFIGPPFSSMSLHLASTRACCNSLTLTVLSSTCGHPFRSLGMPPGISRAISATRLTSGHER